MTVALKLQKGNGEKEHRWMGKLLLSDLGNPGYHCNYSLLDVI